MTPSYLQIILQAVSSFAIAGGLIFTAVQFHQARKAQVVANFSKLVELQMQLRRLRVDDPSLAGVDRRDTELLKTDQEVREYYVNLMQLSLFEIAWFSHRNGQIPDDYFMSWTERIDDMIRQESFRRMFTNPTTKIMHDDFQRYVAGLIAAVEKSERSPPA